MKKFKTRKKKNFKVLFMIIIVIFFFLIFIYISNQKLEKDYDYFIKEYLLDDNHNYLDWTNDIDILINKYYFK